MNGMRCAACGYSQLQAFPNFIATCFADSTIHATPLEKIAHELGKIPNGETGDRVIVLYACPNCGTLRIRIKDLKGGAREDGT